MISINDSVLIIQVQQKSMKNAVGKTGKVVAIDRYDIGNAYWVEFNCVLNFSGELFKPPSRFVFREDEIQRV